MNTKQKLAKIEILESYLNRLHDDSTRYEWGDTECCNCGILAQTITRLSHQQLREAMITQEIVYRSWECICIQHELSQSTCNQTGLPWYEIVSTILAAGFTYQEIKDLEWLTGSGLVKTKLQDVIEYTEKWISKLRTQLQKEKAKIELPNDQRSDDTKGARADVEFLEPEKVKL